MNNEQAIKVLLDEWKCIDRNDGINCDRQCEKCDLVMDSAILKDAYNMAIKALEQEPSREFEDYENEIEDLHNRLDIAEYDKERLREEVTNLEAKIKALSQEPCENAIDREYLFKVLDDFCGHDRTATITLDTLADLVYDMPSVTQKPGKWIIDQKEGYRIWHCHCSKCNKDPQDFIGGSENWWVIRLSDFCPNCGAKMESEDKE